MDTLLGFCPPLLQACLRSPDAIAVIRLPGTFSVFNLRAEYKTRCAGCRSLFEICVSKGWPRPKSSSPSRTCCTRLSAVPRISCALHASLRAWMSPLEAADERHGEHQMFIIEGWLVSPAHYIRAWSILSAASPRSLSRELLFMRTCTSEEFLFHFLII